MQRHSHVREEVETAAEECQAKAEWFTRREGASVVNRRAYGVGSGNISTTRGFIAQWSNEAADRTGVHKRAVRAGLSLLIHAEATPEGLEEGATQRGSNVFVQFQLFCDGGTDMKVVSLKKRWFH